MSLLLAALLAGAPATARADAAGSPLVERKLFADLDPRYADVLLRQTAYLDALKASSPATAARYAERATALKDLRDVLDAQAEAPGLNEALRARLREDADAEDPLGLGFGARPERLLAWRARYPGPSGADAGTLAAALWEWTSLTPEQKAWLSDPARGLGAASWEALSFRRRQERLVAWAKTLYDRLMGSSPKTRGELADLRLTRKKIWAALDGDQKRFSGEFMTRAEAAVSGLEKLAALPAGVVDRRDAEVRALLDQAASGRSPEAVLAALGRLFDKASVSDEAVRGQAPARPEQNLSSLDPRVLSAMLAEGLRAEIRDVPTGLAVDRFFAAHPLVIRLRSVGAELAHFETRTGVLVFNERFLTDWIKAQRLTAADVIKSPARFHELVMILAPTFVHESTHQMQKAWADERGLPWWEAQHQEIEAKETESTYVLEKEAKDPAYRAFLRREAGVSHYVAQTIGQAEALRRDPRGFPRVVMTDYYAGLPSLERTAAATLAGLDQRIAQLRRTEDRLGSWGSPRPGDPWGYEDDLDRFYLEGQIEERRAERDQALKTYELSRRREEEALRRLEGSVAGALLTDALASRQPPPPIPR